MQQTFKTNQKIAHEKMQKTTSNNTTHTKTEGGTEKERLEIARLYSLLYKCVCARIRKKNKKTHARKYKLYMYYNYHTNTKNTHTHTQSYYINANKT